MPNKPKLLTNTLKKHVSFDLPFLLLKNVHLTICLLEKLHKLYINLYIVWEFTVNL